MSTDIKILLDAVFGEEAAAVDLTVDRERLVFLVGPNAERSANDPSRYARKTLHRMALSR